MNDLAREAAKLLGDRDVVDVVATVSSVNPDGTVNVNLRGTTVPSLSAFTSYANRAIGDRVLVRVRPAEMVVTGTTGDGLVIPATAPVTVSDSAAPSSDWQAISGIWGIPATASAPAQLWLQRTAPYVPPPPSAPNPATLTVSAIDVDTYRQGGRLNVGKGEQGDYTGRGLQTGVWVFGGGAFSTLAGKTITGCRVTMQRAGSGGFTWGPVPVLLWTHANASLPGTTPTLALSTGPGSLQTNQQATFDVGVPFGEYLRDNGGGLAIYTSNAQDNLETQGAFTVAVDYY